MGSHDRNNHLLQKVTFEIGLPSQEGAFEIQNRISNAFNSCLERLEKIFDEKIGSDRVLTIDKVEIDLGTIHPDFLEDQIRKELEMRVDELLASIEQAMESPESKKANSRYHAALQLSSHNNKLCEISITESSTILSHYEKVIFFLNSGYIQSEANREVLLLKQSINLVLEHHIAEFVNYLNSNHSNSRIFQRLILNLSGGQLQYIVSNMGCSFSSELPVLLKRLENYHSHASLLQGEISIPPGIVLPEIQQKLWWHIFNYYSQPLVKQRSFNVTSLATEIIRILKQPLQVDDSILFELASCILSEEQSIKKAKRIKQLERRIEKHGNSLSPKEGLNKEDDRPAIFKDLNVEIEPSPGRKDSSGANDTVIDRTIYIDNAGLIICGPYLRHFFMRLGLLEGNEFRSEECAWKAIHALQALCGFENNGEEKGYSEHKLVLNKILCGVDPVEVVPEEYSLSETDWEEVQSLLDSIRNNWTIMRGSSIKVLQTTFLQKMGKLSFNGRDWELIVERNSAVEILIDKLPWSISMLKLLWNHYTIHTQW